MKKLSILCAVFSVGQVHAAHANGFGESAPWQFETASEQAANVATNDLIQRKKGGFYDGFDTVVYSTSVTNIGSQINCNNLASAIGNEASNSQAGNAISTALDGLVNSEALGNSSATQGGDGGNVTSGQTNDGTQGSSITDSTVALNNGSSSNGGSANDLWNSQDNSGNQTAGVNSSTACDVSGATITGNSTGGNSGQILNAGE